jgi:uncharacterized protein YkwD
VRHSLQFALLFAFLLSGPARTGPLDVVNDIRARGCPSGPGGSAPLKAERRLDAVAAVNATGPKLAEALKSVGYSTTRATSIYVQGVAGRDQALARVLRDRFCTYLTEPAFQELGTTTRGRDVWIVLARPIVVPSPASAAEVSARVLERVNKARAAPRTCGSTSFKPAKPLRLSAMLSHTALLHARDMASQQRMSHTGSDGTNAAQRVTRAGYKWRAVAENVAAGQETADNIMDGWLASPGHCANVMNPDVTEMGIAYATNEDSPAVIYWAQVFARPR